MRLKKIFAAICAFGLLMTGCGSDSGTDTGVETKDPNSQATIIKLGMISHLNASEKQMEEYLFEVQSKSRAKVVNHVPVFFDSLSLMQLGIDSGKADVISTYKSVANYLIATNDKYELKQDGWIEGLADNFCFAVRKDDTVLKSSLDRVISEMKSDGSLDKLINEYVTNVDRGKIPPAIDIPKIEGVPTIKVGVTGDLPPLDYVSADGSPAGFNTALLAEVGKRLNRNIEIVQIESGARAAALNSDLIDVVFWAILPVGDNLPKDVDKPEGLDLSAPYFKDSVAHIQLKK